MELLTIVATGIFGLGILMGIAAVVTVYLFALRYSTLETIFFTAFAWAAYYLSQGGV